MAEQSDDQANLMDFTFSQMTTAQFSVPRRVPRSLLDETILEEVPPVQTVLARRMLSTLEESPLGHLEESEMGTMDSPLIRLPTGQQLNENLNDLSNINKDNKKSEKVKVTEETKTNARDFLHPHIDHLMTDNEKLRDKVKFLQDQLKEEKDGSDTYRRNIKHLEKELQEFHVWYKAEINELRDTDRRCAQLEKEIGQANSQYEQLYLEKHQLQTQMGKLAQLEIAKQRLEEELDAMKITCGKLQAASMDVETEKSNDGVVAQLQSEIESLKSRNSSLNVQLTKVLEELADFRAAAKEQASYAEEIFCNKDNEILEMQASLQNANDTIRRLEMTTQTKIAEHLKEMKLVQDQLAKERERSTYLESRVERLEETCDQADASEAQYKATVLELQNHVHELEQAKCNDSDHWTVQQQRYQRQISEKESTILELERRLATLELEKNVDEPKVQHQSNASNNSSSVLSGGDSSRTSAALGATSLHSHVALSCVGGIAGAGKIMSLESEKYQLEKEMQRLRKENSQLRAENQRLSNKRRANEKENVVDDHLEEARSMRRFNSECDNPKPNSPQTGRRSPGSLENLAVSAPKKAMGTLPRTKQ